MEGALGMLCSWRDCGCGALSRAGASSLQAAQKRTVPCSWQGSNLCGETPLDFTSIAFLTQPQLPAPSLLAAVITSPVQRHPACCQFQGQTVLGGFLSTLGTHHSWAPTNRQAHSERIHHTWDSEGGVSFTSQSLLCSEVDWTRDIFPPWAQAQAQAQAQARGTETPLSPSTGVVSARERQGGLCELPTQLLGGAEWRSGSVLGP